MQVGLSWQGTQIAEVHAIPIMPLSPRLNSARIYIVLLMKFRVYRNYGSALKGKSIARFFS